MGHGIYFDDEASVEAAKRHLQALRAQNANPADRQKLINQYQAFQNKQQNIAEKVLSAQDPDPKLVNELASSIALNGRLEQDFHQDFEKTLHQESRRLKSHLSHVDSYMASHGYENFNAFDLFTRMGVGNGRILLSNPVIMPFHAPDDIWHDHTHSNPDVKLLTFGKPGKTEGFYADLALYSIPIKNARDQKQLSLLPVILLDPAVMDAFKSLTRHQDHDVQATANRLLQGLESLISFGMHDYVHQMILGETDPQISNLRTLGDEAPLRGFRLPERKAMFDQYHGFKPERADTINYITNIYELHANLMNRDIWQEAFRKTPGLKDNVVKIAVQFLTDLETVREHLAKSHGDDFANRFSALMVEISMSRFLRVVDVNDPLLEKLMNLQQGRNDSFIDASNKLGLASLKVEKNRANKWIKWLRLDEVVVEGITSPKPQLLEIFKPQLLEIFKSKNNLFPQLSKLANENGKIKEDLELTGYENVVARGFGGSAGSNLNVAALMYNFPQGNGPLMKTAKLLQDNSTVMCTPEGGADPIPASLAEAMTQYQTTITDYNPKIAESPRR